MAMSFTYEEMRQTSDAELIKKHDQEARYTVVGTGYYLAEQARRDAQRINRTMVRCTKWITAMTAMMLIVTIVNVLIAVFI